MRMVGARCTMVRCAVASARARGVHVTIRGPGPGRVQTLTLEALACVNSLFRISNPDATTDDASTPRDATTGSVHRSSARPNFLYSLLSRVWVSFAFTTHARAARAVLFADTVPWPRGRHATRTRTYTSTRLPAARARAGRWRCKRAPRRALPRTRPPAARGLR